MLAGVTSLHLFSRSFTIQVHTVVNLLKLMNVKLIAIKKNYTYSHFSLSILKEGKFKFGKSVRVALAVLMFRVVLMHCCIPSVRDLIHWTPPSATNTKIISSLLTKRFQVNAIIYPNFVCSLKFATLLKNQNYLLAKRSPSL